MLSTLALNPSGILPVALIAAFIAACIVFAIIGGRIDKKRRRAMVEMLNAQGWSAVAEPTPEQKAAAFAPVAHLKHLPDGPRGVVWCARGRLGIHPAGLLEYTFATGSGKSRQTHYYTVLFIDAPNSWPAFTLLAKSFFHRIGEKLGLKPDIKLENETFNKRWRIAAEDDNSALAILNPEIQSLLESAEQAEWWGIGKGVIALIHAKRFKIDRLPTLTTRLESFVERLDPSLRETLPRV